jgi:hypothetical protein
MDDQDNDQVPMATETQEGAWDQQAAAADGADGADGAQAPPRRKKRACCFCCLGLMLLPVALLGALLIWVSTGAAPAPADCMPADAQVRVVVREPVAIIERLSRDERWRNIFPSNLGTPGGAPGQKGLPPPDELKGVLWMVQQALGSEAAFAVDENGEWVGASRPGLLARGFERLMRAELNKKKNKKQNFAYVMIGKTAVFAGKSKTLAPIVARKQQILAAAGQNSPPDDVHAEVRFKEFKPGAHGVPDKGLRGAEFVLDLSSAEELSGRLRLDRELATLSGHLQFLAGKHNAPPSLTRSVLKSAALVPADALGYWVWQAPKGAGRWGAGGRFKEWLAISGAELPVEGPEAEQMKKQLGIDFSKLVAEELIGERAVSIVSQQRAGGKPLMAAASLLIETRDPAKAWPVLSRLLETIYKKSADGLPPKDGDLPVYPHLVDRSYRGKTFMELVHVTYPHGSGYRPAFGMAGRFFVATSSKAELKRMIDRASGASGKSLAGDAELAELLKKQPAPAAALLLRPAEKGKELVDLILAMQDRFGDEEKTVDATAGKQAEALSKLFSMLESLRAEWRPQPDGSLKIEIEAKITPPVK